MTSTEIKARRWFTSRQWLDGTKYLSPIVGKQLTIFISKYKEIHHSSEARWTLKECEVAVRTYRWKEVKPSTVIRFLNEKWVYNLTKTAHAAKFANSLTLSHLTRPTKRRRGVSAKDSFPFVHGRKPAKGVGLTPPAHLRGGAGRLKQLYNMKTVTINYFTDSQISHAIVEQWEPLPDMFCPHCGKQTVWHDTGPGDYYANEQYICLSCEHTFTFYSTPTAIIDDETGSDIQRLQGLRKWKLFHLMKSKRRPDGPCAWIPMDVFPWR